MLAVVLTGIETRIGRAAVLPITRAIISVTVIGNVS